MKKYQKISLILPLVTLASVSLSGNAMAWENNINDSIHFDTSNSFSVAQMGGGNRRGERGDKGEKLTERLNLTAEQQQQMQSIRAKYQPQMQTLNQQVRSERDKLRQMMSGNESANNLRSQHNKIASLNQQMSDLRFQSMLEMREVLTPEQRQEWNAMMEERRASWKDKGQQRRQQAN